MATESFGILLAATALGVAAWSQVVDSPREQVEEFDPGLGRFVASFLIFLSVLIIGLTFFFLFIALLTAGSGLGAGGTAFYLVLLSVLLATIPSVFEIIPAMIEEVTDFTITEAIAALIIVLVVGGILAVLVRASPG